MKKLLFILPVLLLALTSCLDDNPENKFTFARACSNRITNLGESETTMKYCTTTYVVDNVTRTIEVNMLNFSVGDETKVTLSFPAMKMVDTDYGFTFSHSGEFSAVVNGAENGNYLISDLTCTNEVYSNTGDRFAELYYLQFKLTTPSQEYIVNSEMMAYNYINTVTNITPLSGGEMYTWKDAEYYFELNPDEKKAKFVANNIKFNPNMPALQGMLIENLDLKANAAGYQISGSDIVPKIADVDYPKYKLTDIEGAITGKTGFLRFTCMGHSVSVELNLKK